MGEIQVDCRPSDGMIISLKSEVPIYISENLFNILSIDDTPGDKVSQNIQVESTSSLKKLNKELGEAIIAEEYEIAARLRDEISALSKKSIKK
tara:strand:+ start:1231 stop:1509 length:279 start_codon:yes stop_codon:yes gene_type:complete